MKRLLNFIGGLMVLLVMLVCASCNRFKAPTFSGDRPDSVFIANNVEAIVNPSFTSVSDVKLFQNRLVEEYSIDETFRTMPEEVLNNVAAVCLKKAVSITKKDIVLEYRANNSVYDNLPTPDTPDNISTEEQTKPESEVSYRYEIDTIDGKPIRTLIKEERTYEK